MTNTYQVLGTLLSRMENAAAMISELEHAAGIMNEYGPGEVARLQAKRHGVLLAASYVKEAAREVHTA